MDEEMIENNNGKIGLNNIEMRDIARGILDSGGYAKLIYRKGEEYDN